LFKKWAHNRPGLMIRNHSDRSYVYLSLLKSIVRFPIPAYLPNPLHTTYISELVFLEDGGL
jgi:hypothetical protein